MKTTLKQLNQTNYNNIEIYSNNMENSFSIMENSFSILKEAYDNQIKLLTDLSKNNKNYNPRGDILNFINYFLPICYINLELKSYSQILEETRRKRGINFRQYGILYCLVQNALDMVKTYQLTLSKEQINKPILSSVSEIASSYISDWKYDFYQTKIINFLLNSEIYKGDEADNTLKIWNEIIKAAKHVRLNRILN